MAVQIARPQVDGVMVSLGFNFVVIVPMAHLKATVITLAALHGCREVIKGFKNQTYLFL